MCVEGNGEEGRWCKRAKFSISVIGIKITILEIEQSENIHISFIFRPEQTTKESSEV